MADVPESRDRAVYVRVNETEQRAFEAAAEKWGLSVPGWVRWHCRKVSGLPVTDPDSERHGRRS